MYNARQHHEEYVEKLYRQGKECQAAECDTTWETIARNKRSEGEQNVDVRQKWVHEVHGTSMEQWSGAECEAK